MAVDPKAPPLPLVMQYPVLPVVISGPARRRTSS